MSWTINSVRMYVQDISTTHSQTVARHSPFGGGTNHQVFGYEDPTVKIKAIVVGSTDMGSIENLAKTGISYALSSPYGALGNYYVMSVEDSIRKTTCQTIRTDLPTTAIVYDVSLELSRDV